MANHTPGELAVHRHECWLVPAGHENRWVGGSIHERESRDDYAQVIAIPHGDRHGRGDKLANAERLVLAWNCHDELVELARLAADVIDDDLENRPARHSSGNLHARLRAVIAKATEPTP